MSSASSDTDQPKVAIKNEPRGKQPWSLVAALVMVILGFRIIPMIVGFILMFVPQFLGLSVEQTDAWLKTPVANFLFVFIAETLTIGALAAFIKHRHASFIKKVALTRPRWRDLGYALAGIVVYFTIFAILLLAIQQIASVNTEQEQALGFDRDISSGGLLLAFLSLVVLAPVAEEILFRGFIYGTLRSHRAKFLLATLITSAVFAFLHLFGSVDGNPLWIAVIDTFALSLVLCYVREKTGSLWASIGIHALKNGIVFANLFFIMKPV